jgi:TorA maturation chaperone TorD
VLENKLFYKHFGLEIRSNAAPDHLLTQLEFLSWLEYRAACAPDPAVDRARDDFLNRRLRPWIGKAVSLAERAESGCYSETLRELAAACGLSPTSASH